MMATKNIKAAYSNHLRRAKRKGLSFEFTFEEWCDWWLTHLGPDWAAKRGSKMGQYVMARKGDKGGYTLDNIECILAEQNVFDQHANGTVNHGSWGQRNGFAKLTEAQVVEIFFSCDDYHQIAAKYNTTRSRVYRIKTRRSWKYITSILERG